MLSREQYEAIGKVALAANELEYVVEAYLIYLLGTPEFELSAKLVLREASLNRKSQLFKDVLCVLKVEYPSLTEQIGKMLELLNAAKKLSERRNELIHSRITRDMVRKQYGLRFRDQWVVAESTVIEELANELLALAEIINHVCGDLWLDLDEARS